MPDITFPWDWKCAGGDPQIMLAQMRRILLRYPGLWNWENPNPELPPKEVVEGCRDVCASWSRRLDAGRFLEPPWVLAAFNSPAVLQAVATFAPVTFNLTYRLRAHTISTSQIIEWISKSNEEEEAAEMRQQLQECGVLAWTGVELQSNAFRFEASVSRILERRMQLRRATLFAVKYKGKLLTETLAADLQGAMRRSLGESAAAMIWDLSVRIDCPTEAGVNGTFERRVR